MSLASILVSIIVPAYNEETTLREVLAGLEALGRRLAIEIILVDDGSNDRTPEIGKQFSIVRVVQHVRNFGKGAAIRTGIKYSKGKILVIQDADLEYPTENIPRIIAPIILGKADAVFGSRFLGQRRGMKISHIIGNKILSAVTSFLYDVRITDIMTGHKAFRKEVLESLRLTEDGFEVEAEISGRLLALGFRLLEIPIQYSTRKKGRSKIKLKHGFTSFATLLAERITMRRH